MPNDVWLNCGCFLAANRHPEILSRRHDRRDILGLGPRVRFTLESGQTAEASICPLCAKMYGPAVGSKMDFRNQRTGEMHQCIRPLKWSNLLRAIMGIRAHPRLTSGKTSKGHFGTESLGCAGQTVRPSFHSISQTSAGKLLILKLVGRCFPSLIS